MQQRRFGVTPVAVPVIGQGTWYIERSDRRAFPPGRPRGLAML